MPCWPFVIGPNWLKAKNESRGRRLDDPKDYVRIEIVAALARNIPVIPVLVDGARMPDASELPKSLKPLARRNAVQIRHTNFASDADALTKKMREALGYDPLGRRWRVRALAAVATAVILLLVGWSSYTIIQNIPAKRQQTTQQRKAENELERNVPAAPEAAKRETDETGDLDKDIASYSGYIRLNPNAALAFYNRGNTYEKKGDHDRAIADYNEAIRIDPKYALAFLNRANVYYEKGDYDRAIVDYNEAIRLDPKFALAFVNRGNTYEKKGDHDRAIADYNEAIRIDPKEARAYCNRGLVKHGISKGSGDQDLMNAMRLDASACPTVRFVP
jgi:tetratricopeptide (TPR) repeat protein